MFCGEAVKKKGAKGRFLAGSELGPLVRIQKGGQVIQYVKVQPEDCAVIFGVTGGVTEAVLRRLAEDHSPATIEALAATGVRGDKGIKELTVPYKGMDMKICVVSGLANARKVLESVKSGEKEYHLIEVMACPGGCVMGGGQPTRLDHKPSTERGKGLYTVDRRMVLKRANENPLMDVFYSGYFKGKAHELLHTRKH